MKENKIIYSINVQDVQTVANQILKRPLTPEELTLVEDAVGDHINWFQAIESAIENATCEMSC